MMEEMKKVAEWARENAEVSHQSETLVCARYGDKRFRVFMDECDPWVGVFDKDMKGPKAKAYYTFEGFLSEMVMPSVEELSELADKSSGEWFDDESFK